MEQIEAFEVAFMAVIAFVVLGIAALANGSMRAALVCGALAVISWGAYISLAAA